MLPELKAKRDLLIDKKLKLLENPIVAKSLNSIDQMIAQATLKNPINLLDDSELLTGIETLVKFIVKDIGLKSEVDVYEVTRFTDFVRKYYSDLTISEIKLAFELSLVEELDDFLPLDKNNIPDKNHYQNFSAEYITKILNAYKKRKNQTWKKAYKSLPVPKKEISDEVKKQNHELFLFDIVEKFWIYVEEGIKPNFIVPFLVIDYLKEAGLIEKEIEISDEERQIALDRIMNLKLYSKFELALIKNSGLKHPEVELTAKSIHMDNIIIDCFDRLIKEKKDLKHYLWK